LLDPNAYNDESEEEVKKPLPKAHKLSSEDEEEDSFELTPDQQFQQDHQKEISHFKQMLKDLKVDVVHSTYQRELPKFIHDTRYRSVPQKYRPVVYEQYVSSCNVEAQRRRLWVKNQEVKDAFAKKLEALIAEGAITSDSEYTDLHKVLHGRDPSYDQLYKGDDGKEFMNAEL
jgi:hypothetical protein